MDNIELPSFESFEDMQLSGYRNGSGQIVKKMQPLTLRIGVKSLQHLDQYTRAAVAWAGAYLNRYSSAAPSRVELTASDILLASELLEAFIATPALSLPDHA